MKILVCGDVHGEWNFLNKLINKKLPDIILQCGDWGWWPGQHGLRHRDVFGRIHVFDSYGVKNRHTKIFWCPGNHEDWWDLLRNRSQGGPYETQKDVFYMPRGSTLTLPDGRNVLFMGGADSIDKDARVMGIDWFPEEIITQKDVYDLPDAKMDIVISHTCPTEFQAGLDRKLPTWRLEKFQDPSRHALSYVLNFYKPSLWFFGHYHVYVEGKFENTKWTCLNMAPESGWWQKLEELK